MLDRKRSEFGTRSLWLLLGIIALLPLDSRTRLPVTSGGGDGLSVSAYDIPLLLLLVLTVGDLAQQRAPVVRPTEWPLLAKLLIATVAWGAFTALMNPSWRALELGFHAAGAWATVYAVRRLDPRQQTLVLVAVVILGVFEAILGAAQALNGELLGINFLESGSDRERIGERHAAIGSRRHRNDLAALLLLSIGAACVLQERVTRVGRHRLTIAAALLMSITVTLTLSRAALLALVPMLVILIWRPRGRRLALVIAIGLTMGVPLISDGVAARAQASARSESFDTGRSSLVEEAIEMITEHPLTGVGPGRYLMAAPPKEGGQRVIEPHNVVLHAAAESGVIGGVLVACTLAAFALWTMRRGGLAVLAALPLIPYLLLHTYPFGSTGQAISGLWVAVVLIAVRQSPLGASCESRQARRKGSIAATPASTEASLEL